MADVKIMLTADGNRSVFKPTTERASEILRDELHIDPIPWTPRSLMDRITDIQGCRSYTVEHDDMKKVMCKLLFRHGLDIDIDDRSAEIMDDGGSS